MTKHILLVQDDASSAKIIIEAVANSSDGLFQVEWVRTCSEGLERLDGITAILADLYLPDSQGIDTFERLFRAAPRIPILLLVDAQNEETAKLAVQRGAQDYLFTARLDAYLLPKAIGSMIERAVHAEALFQEKERAQLTLNSIGDAVVSTDLSGKVTFLNTVAEELTGWSLKDALGRSPVTRGLLDLMNFLQPKQAPAGDHPLSPGEFAPIDTALERLTRGSQETQRPL